ncbi:sulfotransferase domain-containing protein [Frigoriglobus tundricola]|uniref:Sulfotransferase family protein n=1 Tax=Frigoriglobus tundricola TaxID=2774151 RepID=A0A6M5Z1F9_9BACT|nr:sulfotransferase domain-containing protein [Frigoriglobus tundricola]QJW99313.1 Sulfotransferase family protein [Frigoriglobus tundricola]
MIVWLASYPRSGNTLLRQVLKRCFDRESCEGLEPVPDRFRQPDKINEEHFGVYFVSGDPEAFYRRSRAGADPVFIKTHRPPRDAARAIYVIRDGRLALESFVRFQEVHHPGECTFESLVVGQHVYGDWTGHYRVWSRADRGPTLFIRFEDLVRADAALLERIGAFTGIGPPLRVWENPQSRLRAHNPVLFGNGESVWRPNAFWTPSRLRAFHTLHGPLMIELGYAQPDEVSAWTYPTGSPEERALRSAFQKACASFRG